MRAHKSQPGSAPMWQAIMPMTARALSPLKAVRRGFAEQGRDVLREQAGIVGLRLVNVCG